MSEYEKVKSNAGCTGPGDLTYYVRNIKSYNGFRHGQNTGKKEKRDEKCEKRRYVQGSRKRTKKGVAICTGTNRKPS